MAPTDSAPNVEASSLTMDERQDPPAFDPEQLLAPAYSDITTDDDLISYSRAYIAVVIAHYDLEVDAEHIEDWTVNHRAKRRAAAVRHPDLSKMGVHTIAGMTSPNWEALCEDLSAELRRSRFDDPKEVHLNLTWEAFEAFDEAEWRETLRHEAAHIEQYHEHGAGDHGLDFERRAKALGTTVDCKQFADYNYQFYCTECGADRGGRYRECKAVRDAREQGGRWLTGCCDAPQGLRK